MIKEYQTLIGLLAIAVAVYLGLTSSQSNDAPVKTELDSCIENGTELYGDKATAQEICILSLSS